MRVNNNPNVIEAGTVLNTDLESIPIPLTQIYGYAVQAVWTGTPTGAFTLQGSCDPNRQGSADGYAPTNWSDITDSAYSVTGAGSYMWNVFDTMYNWVRLIYTDGSSGESTAVLTVSTINTKGI